MALTKQDQTFNAFSVKFHPSNPPSEDPDAETRPTLVLGDEAYVTVYRDTDANGHGRLRISVDVDGIWEDGHDALPVRLDLPGGTAWHIDGHGRVITVDTDGYGNDHDLDEDRPTMDAMSRPDPYAGDTRPVHFTRAETQRMIAQLRSREPIEINRAHNLLADRLADTDRMLDAWDADQDEDAPEAVSYDQLRDGLRERGITGVEITAPPTTEYDWNVRRDNGDRVALGGEVHGWTWTYYADEHEATDGIEDTGETGRRRMLDAVAFLLDRPSWAR